MNAVLFPLIRLSFLLFIYPLSVFTSRLISFLLCKVLIVPFSQLRAFLLHFLTISYNFAPCSLFYSNLIPIHPSQCGVFLPHRPFLSASLCAKFPSITLSSSPTRSKRLYLGRRRCEKKSPFPVDVPLTRSLHYQISDRSCNTKIQDG